MIYRRSARKTTVSPFAKISHLSLKELEAMFLSVPVRSLGDWTKYFTDKNQPEVCRVIERVILYRV